MAGEAELPDPASLPPDLLPASQSNRTIMGIDAQTRHSQQVLRHFQGIQRGDVELPARGRSGELARVVRPGHGQFPSYQPEGIPDYRVSRVYMEISDWSLSEGEPIMHSVVA